MFTCGVASLHEQRGAFTLLKFDIVVLKKNWLSACFKNGKFLTVQFQMWQHCIPEGFDMQFLMGKYPSNHRKGIFICTFKILVCTFEIGVLFILVTYICTSTSSIYASFLFEILGRKVLISLSSLHLCSFPFCLMIIHSSLTFSAFAFLNTYLEFSPVNWHVLLLVSTMNGKK